MAVTQNLLQAPTRGIKLALNLTESPLMTPSSKPSINRKVTL